MFQEDAFPRTEPGVREMFSMICQVQCLEIEITERVNKTSAELGICIPVVYTVHVRILPSKGLLVVLANSIIVIPLITLLKGTEVTQMLMVWGDGLCCFSFVLSPRTAFLIIFLSQFLEENNDVT